jgi:hypothetical protein
VTWGEKPGIKKETTFPVAANAAMRLALMTANLCMERNAGAEKEDGKCSQLEDGKVERCKHHWLSRFPKFDRSLKFSDEAG